MMRIFSDYGSRLAAASISLALVICFACDWARALTPVAHWTFDQGINNYDLTEAIDSVNANNGTWQGANTAGLSYAAGQIGGAVRLRGANNDHFLVPSIPQINNIAATPEFPDNPVLGVGITVSAWINVDEDSAQGYKGILVTRTAKDVTSAGESGADQNWGIAWEVSGNPFNSHIDSRVSGTGLDSSVAPEDHSILRGQWHHVALVWGNVNEALTPAQRVYVDGHLMAEIPDTGVFELIQSGAWLIGDDSCCGGREFDGLLDDLAVFDFALSTAEIQTIYSNGLVGIDASGINTGQLAPGDIDGGGISIDDFHIILDNLGSTVNARNLGDLDGNRKVDLDDFQRWLEVAPASLAAQALASYSTNVPEPAGLVFVGLAAVVSGGLLRLRRRQRG